MIINIISIVKFIFPLSFWVVYGLFPLNESATELAIRPVAHVENGETGFYMDPTITDGPYIFYEGKDILVKWIENDSLVTEKLTKENQAHFKSLFLVFPDPASLKQKKHKKPDYRQEFKGAENMVALSDIHGQYDLFVQLLKAHSVIDSNGNWSFGDGHLVVNGDIFDRGEHVTEILWLVYQLEKQAEQQSGKVHFLLGNHEVMVLENDLRYIHEKYSRSAQLMDTTYNYLYSDMTLLGRWLRTKPLMITINDMLITHAGISPEFIESGLTPARANKYFLNNVLGQEWEMIKADSVSLLLEGKNGPLWYRGYFKNSEFTEENLDEILHYFEVNHIVVGHTSLKKVTPLFGGKVFGIDSSIKLGEYGEVLIYKNGQFFTGTPDGQILKVKTIKPLNN